MRTLSALLPLIVGLAFVFWAPAAKAHCPHGGDETHEHCVGGSPNSGPFQFAGYSSTPFVNGSGLQAINETCQFDFGPEARICALTEFLHSPNAEAPPLTGALDAAWVANENFGGCDLWTSVIGSGGATTIENPLSLPGTIKVSNQNCDQRSAGRPTAPRPDSPAGR